MTFEDYQRLTGGQESIINLLDLPLDEADIEFETTQSRDLVRPADLS